MNNLSQFEFSDLLDMLSLYTYRYMKMLAGGSSREDFTKCRKIVAAIQIEIKQRQTKSKNSNGPDKNSPLSQDYF